MLTSQSAKESGAVDPKAQITADEAKGKELQQKEELVVPKKKVASQTRNRKKNWWCLS